MGNKQSGDKSNQQQGGGEIPTRQSQGDSKKIQQSAPNQNDKDRNSETASVGIQEEVEIPETKIEIKFSPELGGGKGWPPDANVVLYHHATGLILAGTECGTLYAYGDGFQYMQPAIVQMDITHILSLYEEKILVCFADNSMAIFQLPNLHLLHRIESSWLSPICGDVTTIHIDESRGKYYAYIGTSEGFVRVVHLINEFREVEYCITTTDSGVTGKMAVSDLQLSPKDEKLLIIAYDSIDSSPGNGAVVIFDLSKKKSFRTYKMNSGVTSVSSNHTGDMLFAGTRQGEVLQLGIDKVGMTTVWNSKSELVEGTDEDEFVNIRKMTWMFPQTPNSDGCLFVLLGSFGTDTDNLKSVIVALALNNAGNLKSIFNVPPLQNNAEVVGFRLVSTWDKSSSHDKGPVPGLLLLTQASTEDRDSVRELMAIRCPVGELSTWELELGMLPDPRPAMEVLPGKSPVTFIAGCIPGVPIGNFLINLEKGKSARNVRKPSETGLHSINEDQEASPPPASVGLSRGKSRRVSARDFFEELNVAMTNFDDLAANANTWEMVLASGESGDLEKMDVIFLGQADGSVLAWGVSLPPQNTGESAKSNCWVPLTALKCGTTEITAIIANGKYLVVGDESGTVVVWDCEDESAEYLREVFRGDVQQPVASLYVDPEGLFIIIGTQDGQMFALTDWNRRELRPLEGLRQLPGLSGSISYIFSAPYWKETCYEQVAYILFSCGYVVVVSLPTLEIRAYSGLIRQDDNTDDEMEGKILFGFLVTTQYQHVTTVTEEMLESIPPVSAQSTPTQTQPESKSFMKKLKRASGEAITLAPMVIPPHGPRYLLYVCGKHLFRCDLTLFSRPIPASPTLTFSASTNVLLQSSQISASNIVSCQILSYIEDATRFWSKPIFTLSFIDEMSDMYFISPRSCFLINRHDSLPNVLTDPYNITNGTILSNGCTYICSNRNIIYSINPYNPGYLLSNISPSRGDMSAISPDISQQLLQKEVIDTTTKSQKTKRRSSFLSLPSSGVDLEKLFMKTFDQKSKEETFNRRSMKLSSQESKEREEAYTIKSDHVKDNTSSAGRTKAILDETRLNFEERGERINILNKRTEDFNMEAAKFKANSAAHKEKMKQKAQRWGVF